MKYVEFFDTRLGRKKYLGRIDLENGRLEMSHDLAGRWVRSNAYHLLAKGGYGLLYDPEKILDALPETFREPDFQATEVKER